MLRIVTAGLALAWIWVVAAAEASPASSASSGAAAIGVELNDLQPGADSGGGCRAVFVVTNNLGKPIDKFGLRVVAFDKSQRAFLFLTLDIGAMPISKTRVLRFDLGNGIGCSDISRLVLDDVTSCTGDGLNTADCLAAIAVSSRAAAPLTL
jgi:hypothetical protein